MAVLRVILLLIATVGTVGYVVTSVQQAVRRHKEEHGNDDHEDNGPTAA